MTGPPLGEIDVLEVHDLICGDAIAVGNNYPRRMLGSA